MSEQQPLALVVIGVDPGPVVGLCGLWAPVSSGGPWYRHQPLDLRLVQADPDTALSLLFDWLHPRQATALVAAERFVDGRRSARVAGRHGSQAAKDFLGALRHRFPTANTSRAAADVKPWATDARLKAAGIEIANPSTMRHALDAGRHALYAAVWNGGWPDPLATRKEARP